MNKSTPSTAMIVLAFLSVYIIWGSTYLGIRFAIETIPPFLMAGVRFLIAGGVLFAYTRLRGMAMPTRIHWRSAIVIGGLLLLGGNGMVTWSEQYIASGLAAVLVTTVPLWIVVFDAIRQQRTPGLQVLGGLLLGFSGVVFLVGPANLTSDADINLLGAGALILASVLWAIGSLYSREAPLPEGSPLVSVSMEMLAGGVWLVLMSLVTGDYAKLDIEAISLSSIIAVAYLIIFGSIIAFTAYIWLLQNVSPARAATYAYVNPVIAIVLGWTIGDEALTASMIIAAVMIIGAVAMINTHRQKQETDKVEEEFAAPPKLAGENV
ncbi:MAG: drug/metabolite exporter YedA [Chloroflexi bacterium]|nr:drug/metabolite exporter YedA [Chloroflexota bacterium]